MSPRTLAGPRGAPEARRLAGAPAQPKKAMGQERYSTLAPENCTIFAHFSVSIRWMAQN
jgi:hypothetical protein